MSIKLVALDLDGTTLNKQGKVSEETKATLNKLHKRGIHVVIATGRVRSALPEDVLAIEGLEYTITSNGAMITDLTKNQVIYENCIHPNEIPLIINKIKNEDIILEIFAKGNAYIDKKAFDIIDSSGLPQWHIDYIKRTRKPEQNIFDFMMTNQEKIENININIVDDKERAIFRRKMETLNNLTITSSSMRNVELGGATTSKADALKHLCNILNVNDEDTVAIGDSQNDIEMLKFAGISIAMGNAADNIKELSDIVTDDNEHHGVSTALEKLLNSSY